MSAELCGGILLLVCLISPVISLNNRPIIGVLAQETSSDKHGDSYIISSYVETLRASGARVVPIRIKEPDSYYEKIFKSINGVLFPGGGVDIMTSYHAKAANKLYNMALRANDEGDFFPLWGTCQGLQLLSAMTAGENLLADMPYVGNLPLLFKPAYKDSHLYGGIPEDVFTSLSEYNVTANQHMYGLSPTNFTRSSKLSSFYTVLTTNFDEHGKEFISTFEAKKYPFFGVQWHPEKNQFNWNMNFDTNHSERAVRVAQYISNFIVAQSRRSDHHFPDLDSEIEALIDNYHPHYSADKSFVDTYYFNYRRRQTT